MPRAGAGQKKRFYRGGTFGRLDGGAKGSRTPDLLNAIQALSQLSYGPITDADVGTSAFRHIHQIDRLAV
jgi:hypothetical protein